ncbi:MAG: methyl-accepting chemotaxis protein [Tissierellales bacterium]|jgi:methyl-accepting chemotaxis protein|nr:methyl-accepting chemotaxis protein [Tissierellales bacterium]
MKKLQLWSAIVDAILLAILLSLKNHWWIACIAIGILLLLKNILIIKLGSGTKHLHGMIDKVLTGQMNIKLKKTNIPMIDQLIEKFSHLMNKTKHVLSEYENTSQRMAGEVYQLTRISTHLRESQSDIAATVQELTEAGMSNAEAVSEVDEKITSLTKIAGNIQENAETSYLVAQDSGRVIKESFESFKEIINQIKKLQEENNLVMEEITKLRDYIGEVDLIIKTVNGIADQTQLLALNASIEAARAGEAGKGFAVVAGEVSKLADESSQSANQIRTILSNITGNVDGLTGRIEHQTETISKNVNGSQEALSKFDVIEEAMNMNIEAVSNIKSQANEQKNYVNQIKEASDLVNENTQKNAAVSEEISATTQEQLASVEAIDSLVHELSEEVETTKKVISEFVNGFVLSENNKKKVELAKKHMANMVINIDIESNDVSSMENYLRKESNKVGAAGLYAIANEDGMIIMASKDVPKEIRNIKSRPFFAPAMSGETFVSAPYISIVSNQYNLSISMPIENNGRICGVLVGNIGLEE